MEKILISACLLGENVRYDGGNSLSLHPAIQLWLKQKRVVPCCPEVLGGLPTPRAAAEITQQHPTVITTADGSDVTKMFQQGADKALELVIKHRIRYALLKAKSPSCGNEQIYDGQFNGQLIDGLGITAQQLSDAGVQVFNETQIEQLLTCLDSQQEPNTDSK